MNEETIETKENTETKENKKEVKKEKKTKINKEIEALKIALASSEEKNLRLQAEFVNVRNRQLKEIEDFRKYEGEELIKQLLLIVDNFERAIKLDDNDLSDELSKFLSGFKIMYTNLISILESVGVKEIECLNKEFDPSYAEAVITDTVEGKPSGLVLEVFQKGYMYKDKLLRAAMVKVNN